MLYTSAKKKIQKRPNPLKKKYLPYSNQQQELTYKSVYWLEYELDKYQKPVNRKLAKCCSLKTCNKRAQIKITYMNNRNKYFCSNHGEKKYWEDRKDIWQIEKKWWYK